MRRVWVGAFIGERGRLGRGESIGKPPGSCNGLFWRVGVGAGGRGAVTGRSRRRGCRGWQARVPGRELGLVPVLGPELARRQRELVLGELLRIPGY